jgi:hypothetical protein
MRRIMAATIVVTPLLLIGAAPPVDVPPVVQIDPSEFARRAVEGATIANVTVTGPVNIDVPNLTLRNAEMQGTITLGPQARHVRIFRSRLLNFESTGADNVVVKDNTLDGRRGKGCQNFIWSGPNGDPSDGWTLTGNTFSNYQCEDPHSEALFIGGYTRNVQIEGNAFYENGNTADIFVSWCAPDDCDGTGGRYVGDPRDPSTICIKGNTFGETWQAYFHIVIRQEWTDEFGGARAPNGHGIYKDDNVVFDPRQSNVRHSTHKGQLVQLYDSDPVHGTRWAAGKC